MKVNHLKKTGFNNTPDQIRCHVMIQTWGNSGVEANTVKKGNQVGRYRFSRKNYNIRYSLQI